MGITKTDLNSTTLEVMGCPLFCAKIYLHRILYF